MCVWVCICVCVWVVFLCKCLSVDLPVPGYTSKWLLSVHDIESMSPCTLYLHVFFLCFFFTVSCRAAESSRSSNSEPVFFVLFCFPAGLSSPPANITTSAVPSIVTPIVNGFTGIPHQPNGHPAVETVYTNGLPPYSTQSPTAADTLQQAFTGVQQYTGVRQECSVCYGEIYNTKPSMLNVCQPRGDNHWMSVRLYAFRQCGTETSQSLLITHVLPVRSTLSILDTISTWDPPIFFFLHSFSHPPLLLSLSLSLRPTAAIYPATTLTPIGQTLPQPPQVIQQQQQREGEGEKTLLLFCTLSHTSSGELDT